jgi:hypothetical protein
MKIFAHRANLAGPGSGENAPRAIQACLNRGFGVEVDVWAAGGALWLGHDRAADRVAPQLFESADVVAHAKNIEAMEALTAIGAVFFALDRDEFALCSDGRVWTNYGAAVVASSIVCSPELVGSREDLGCFYERVSGCVGVCTDFPERYQKLLGERSTPDFTIPSRLRKSMR